ncbi:MAG: diacylglycerol kinase [Pseudomonadota bacterium]
MKLAEEIRRILRTAGYSLDGWRHGWREEKSLRQWLGVNLASWAALAILRPPLWACALIVMQGLLLLALELVNSAIEAAIDYISTETHPLAKAAKDTGSAAVAVMGLSYIATWLFALIALF